MQFENIETIVDVLLQRVTSRVVNIYDEVISVKTTADWIGNRWSILSRRRGTTRRIFAVWPAGLVATVERRETEVTATVAAVSVGGTVVRTVSAVAVIDQVDVAEVAVVVAVTIRVAAVVGVARPGRTRLHVRVSVGADDERVVIPVVEAIVAALSCSQSINQSISQSISRSVNP